MSLGVKGHIGCTKLPECRARVTPCAYIVQLSMHESLRLLLRGGTSVCMSGGVAGQAWVANLPGKCFNQGLHVLWAIHHYACMRMALIQCNQLGTL